jgi:hypothetical protein
MKEEQKTNECKRLKKKNAARYREEQCGSDSRVMAAMRNEITGREHPSRHASHRTCIGGVVSEPTKRRGRDKQAKRDC